MTLFADLLAEGKSTGETARLLVDQNYRHHVEKMKRENEEQLIKQPKGKVQKPEKDAKGGKGKKVEPTVEEAGPPEPPVEEERLPPERSWYNFICYGLPNLIVKG